MTDPGLGLLLLVAAFISVVTMVPAYLGRNMGYAGRSLALLCSCVVFIGLTMSFLYVLTSLPR